MCASLSPVLGCGHANMCTSLSLCHSCVVLGCVCLYIFLCPISARPTRRTNQSDTTTPSLSLLIPPHHPQIRPRIRPRLGRLPLHPRCWPRRLFLKDSRSSSSSSRKRKRGRKKGRQAAAETQALPEALAAAVDSGEEEGGGGGGGGARGRRGCGGWRAAPGAAGWDGGRQRRGSTGGWVNQSIKSIESIGRPPIIHLSPPLFGGCKPNPVC